MLQKLACIRGGSGDERFRRFRLIVASSFDPFQKFGECNAAMNQLAVPVQRIWLAVLREKLKMGLGTSRRVRLAGEMADLRYRRRPGGLDGEAR